MNIKKTALFFFFALSSFFALAQCFNIYPTDDIDTTIGLSNYNAKYYKQYFFDKDTGLVLGINKLYQTNNGGKTWKILLEKKNSYYYDMTINAKSAYIMTPDSIIILKNKNKIWNKYSLPTYLINNWDYLQFWTLDCNGQDTLTIVGSLNINNYLGTIYKSYNGGKDWSQKYLSPNTLVPLGFSYIKYFNKNIGFANNVRGGIFKTKDGGETWNVCKPNDTNIYANRLLDMTFQDSLHGWACSNFNWLIKTEDGGETWQDVFPAKMIAESFFDVTFIDSLHGFIGSSEGVYHTKDGGKNWNLRFVDSSFVGKDIFFTDPHHAWIVGNRVYKLDLSPAIPDCHLTLLTDSTVLLPYVGSAFAWQHASDCVEGFRISLGTSPFGTQLYDHFDIGNTTTWTPPKPLPDNTQLYFTVYPYSSLGTASACQTFSYQTTEKVSVEDLKEEEGLKVRVVPNPFSEATTLRIESSKEQAVQVTFIDTFGRVVLTQSLLLQEGQTRFSTANSSDWATGYYSYIVTIATKTVTGKLIKW